MKPWEQKANRIINQLCQESYRDANFRRGKKLKRHVPYSVSADAAALVECLRTGDELQAKQIFQDHAFGIVNK